MHAARIRGEGRVFESVDVASERLRLGKELELRVAGKGVAVGTKKTTSRGGDLDAVVGERVLEIDTVYVLSPEELVA